MKDEGPPELIQDEETKESQESVESPSNIEITDKCIDLSAKELRLLRKK
jgi:hypothetical protein